MITLPKHVTDILVKDTNENANDLPFKLITTSDDDIYLWFITKKEGFLVKGDNWVNLNMADAAKFDKNNVIQFKELPLSIIGKNNAKLYSDSSLSWFEKDEYLTSPSNLSRDTLIAWSTALKEKSQVWHIKLRMLDKQYLRISAALDALIQAM